MLWMNVRKFNEYVGNAFCYICSRCDQLILPLPHTRAQRTETIWIIIWENGFSTNIFIKWKSNSCDRQAATTQYCVAFRSWSMLRAFGVVRCTSVARPINHFNLMVVWWQFKHGIYQVLCLVFSSQFSLCINAFVLRMHRLASIRHQTNTGHCTQSDINVGNFLDHRPKPFDGNTTCESSGDCFGFRSAQTYYPGQFKLMTPFPPHTIWLCKQKDSVGRLEQMIPHSVSIFKEDFWTGILNVYVVHILWSFFPSAFHHLPPRPLNIMQGTRGSFVYKNGIHNGLFWVNDLQRRCCQRWRGRCHR